MHLRKVRVQLLQIHKRTCDARQGVTVVEVLAVIATITLLAALVFPAVQNARESSRRTQCANNLRQIGQANYHHESVHGTFSNPRLHLRELLPYLEQEELYAHFEATNSSRPSPHGSVPLLICPSDSEADVALNHTNYWLNTGTWLNNNDCNGIVVCDPDTGRRALRLQEVRDGLSNTVMYSERLTLPYLGWYQEPGTTEFDEFSRGRHAKRFVWWPNEMYWPGDPSPLDTACQLVATRVTAEIPNGSEHRAFGAGSAWYNHASVPNSYSCYRTVANIYGQPHIGTVGNIGSATVPPTSVHPGGVQALLADGSVRFVSDHVDLATWRALGTRAESDTVGTF